MINLLHQIDSNVLSFILILFSVLSFASVLFFVWGKLKPNANLMELKTRCKSWWIMSSVFLIATVFSTKISYVAFALLSFVALRELFTILKLRQEDRSAMLLCYLAIPIQYFFTYQGYLIASLVFIPVFMFVALPFRLVLVGQTEGIIQSMAVIPATLMIALFGLSHLGLLLSIPGGRGLLFFLVFIVEMNDVFQFVWGKLLGKHLHQYDTFTIQLMAYHCDFVTATFKLTDHDEYCFVRPSKLKDYKISPADMFFVDLIAKINFSTVMNGIHSVNIYLYSIVGIIRV